MSSLATVSLPPYSLAISSSTGANILHGPHHSAQKSTSTGLPDLQDVLVERRVGYVLDGVTHGKSFRVRALLERGRWSRRSVAECLR